MTKVTKPKEPFWQFILCHTPTDGGIIGARHWAKQIVQKFPQQLLLQIQLSDTSHTVSQINKQVIIEYN